MNTMLIRKRPYRRGSALMIALALLMMLAVFAALFLTSSRFDSDAATASIDYIRMDLYSEGLAQYAQFCMVASLWGFDEQPLNNDTDPTVPVPPNPDIYHRYPYDPAKRVYEPVLSPAVGSGPPPYQVVMPGPDNPFDYFGGMVLLADPDNSMASPIPNAWPKMSGDEIVYYPNFWLTDPRIRNYTDPLYTAGIAAPGVTGLMYAHPAFAPGGLLTTAAQANLRSLPPFGVDPSGWLVPQKNDFWARWADLDGDGHADTPWLFSQALGNGLYIRAAIRVEDTSSRINANVANTPLYVQGSLNTNPVNADPYQYPGWPYLTQAESVLRKTIYPGYPWLGFSGPPNDATDSRFPLLVTGSTYTNDQVGHFLSEFNLLNGVSQYLGPIASGGIGANPADAPKINFGLTASATAYPGRHGTPSASPILADSLYLKSSVPSVLPALACLTGDADKGNPGRLGRVIEQGLPSLGLAPWDPSHNASTQVDTQSATWRTYDPDGLSRRIDSPRAIPGSDQDRPFGVDDAFDLMNLRGLSVGGAALRTDEQRYLSNVIRASSSSRLERLWSDLLVNNTEAHSVQWRRLLTSYSWSLNFCPYGEHPAVAALSTPIAPREFCKVNLNSCAPEELDRALDSAARHTLIRDAAVTLSPAQRQQFVANFLNYRSRQMNATDLAHYLRARLSYILATTPPVTDGVGYPPPAQSRLAWTETAWAAYWPTSSAAKPTEKDYLGWLFEQWVSDRTTFWTEINNALMVGVSVHLPETYGASVGLDRHPFITEVYMNIQFNDVTSINPNTGSPYLGVIELADPVDSAKRNDYAIELYNPWDTVIDLSNWHLVVTNGAKPSDLTLSGIIPPHGRAVVTRFLGFAPPGALEIAINPTDTADPRDLVLAAQNNTDPAPLIQLQYNGATYDGVPAEWTRELNGTPGTLMWDIVRRDDNGFWCYQRWAAQYTSASPGPVALTQTLGLVNLWNTQLGTPMPDDPWNPDIYGPNPAVPCIQVGQILSPAELTLIPIAVPQTAAGTMTLPDAITPYLRSVDGLAGSAEVQINANPTIAAQMRFQNLQFARPMLFHRDYVNGPPTNAYSNFRLQTANYAGVFQALMDFVTVTDLYDGTLASLRVPGRLNINTVADWYSLDQVDTLPYISKTLSLDPAPPNPPGLNRFAFWRRLLDYRDKADPNLGLDSWYGVLGPTDVSGRRTTTGINTAVGVRDAADANGRTDLFAYLGFEQLGEICNIQNANDPMTSGAMPGFDMLWQNPFGKGIFGGVAGGGANFDPMLPQQYLRKFAANANRLSTRSDTYMVTMRIEIVRPVYNKTTPNEIDRIDSLGQREYMYLVDRSFCVQPLQLGGTAANDFNGRYNPAYIPPRVWRVSSSDKTGY